MCPMPASYGVGNEVRFGESICDDFQWEQYNSEYDKCDDTEVTSHGPHVAKGSVN